MLHFFHLLRQCPTHCLRCFPSSQPTPSSALVTCFASRRTRPTLCSRRFKYPLRLTAREIFVEALSDPLLSVVRQGEGVQALPIAKLSSSSTSDPSSPKARRGSVSIRQRPSNVPRRFARFWHAIGRTHERRRAATVPSAGVYPA